MVFSLEKKEEEPNIKHKNRKLKCPLTQKANEENLDASFSNLA